MYIILRHMAVAVTAECIGTVSTYFMILCIYLRYYVHPSSYTVTFTCL